MQNENRKSEMGIIHFAFCIAMKKFLSALHSGRPLSLSIVAIQQRDPWSRQARIESRSCPTPGRVWEAHGT